MRRSLVWRTYCLAIAAVAMSIPLSADAGENPPKEAPRPAASDDGFPLPPGAIHRFGNRKMRHPGGIVASAVSPDGKYLATGSRSAVIVWDLKTLKAKHLLVGAQLRRNASDRGGQLTFLPDSTSLLVTIGQSVPASDLKTLAGSSTIAQVWDIVTGKVKFKIAAPWVMFNASWPCEDGKEIAVCYGMDSTGVHYFDARDGKPLRTINAPQPFESVWVAAGGTAIAYRLKNAESLSLIDPLQGVEIDSLTNIDIAKAAFSRDGKLFVYSDTTGKVHVHDVSAKKELFVFDHPEPKKPGPMIVSPDGKTLYFSSDHGRLFRWNLKTNK